jgi:hypothetical protein
MSTGEEKEILTLMRAAQEKARGYADFFGWKTDRDIEEWGVVDSLRESLEINGELFFSDVTFRGRGNDPPDCEAADINHLRIAIEVTELVDSEAIKAYKQKRSYKWESWTKERLISSLSERIATKGVRYATLKGGPYEGGYVIVIHTDESMLSIRTVKSFLDEFTFQKPLGVTRAFLLMSYDPKTKHCPYVELTLKD